MDFDKEILMMNEDEARKRARELLNENQVDLTSVRIILGFAFGLILGIILCTPRNVNDKFISHNEIVYCEVE